MSNNDLIRWTTSEIDFYSLLGLTYETFSSSELRRAYRKTALKYHPDKVGASYDPDKFELFQASYEVLNDAELKAKYDNHRNARIQKQRANELFEGKRRAMKEDLEARERGEGGTKRGREDDEEAVMLRRLAEEGRKRRAKRTSMMGESRTATSSPAPPSPRKQSPEKKAEPAAEPPEEDEMEKRERELTERIQAAEAAKAKRKADKKARKSGVFVPLPAEFPAMGKGGGKERMADRDTTTPIKRPDIFKELKADEKSSASPKFSFSPNTPQKSDFKATMARLKVEGERRKLEEEIRQREAEAA